jgi:hypothetical protein
MLTNTARCSGDVITAVSRKHSCAWWRYAAALVGAIKPNPRKAWAVTEANRRMAQHYSPSLTQRLSDLLASLGSSDEVAPIDITTFGRKTAEIIAGGCMNQRTSNVAVPKLKRTRRAARPS